MKKMLTRTILWTSLVLTIPGNISGFNHGKKIEEISKKTQIILELKKEQEINLKLQKIQEAIDKDLDPNATRVLLIWINNYKYVTHLLTPRDDVKMIKKLLILKYWIKKENITVLLDSRATKKRILSKMRKLEKATPDDKKMIIYFSWHWIALDNKWREVLNYDKWGYSWYISPYEANIWYSQKFKSTIFVRKTRISRQEINKAIWYKQKNLLILDACYSWAMAKWSEDNEVLVTASNKEEAIAAREYSKRKTSLFSNAVFGIITWNKQNSLWKAIINSWKKINEQVIIEQSHQEPLIKTWKMTLFVRENRFEEKPK